MNLEPPYNVIIYSGGKCGGSSLLESFKEKFNPMFIHTNEQFLNCRRLGIYPFKQTNNKEPIFNFLSDDVIIIDSYRNPIDRKLSSYFQNLEHNRKEFKVPKNLSIEEEVDFFQMNIFSHLENYEGITEPMKYYGLDKLEYQGKYWIGKKDKKLFIRLKFELIKDWGEILSDILGVEIKIKSSNLSIDKEYYNYYKNFCLIYKNKFLY